MTMNPLKSTMQNMTLEEAEAVLDGRGAQIDTTGLPNEIQERLKISSEHAMAGAEKGHQALDKSAYLSALKEASRPANGLAKRVTWLRKATDTWSSAFAPESACKSGCSHCCHIPVLISHAEALVVGKAIGRMPVTPAKLHHTRVNGYESPCTFLADNACSIYDNRPIACRAHLNLDRDDLLCRLIDKPVPVPLMDNRHIHMASFEIQPKSAMWADIRDWFPKDAAAA